MEKCGLTLATDLSSVTIQPSQACNAISIFFKTPMVLIELSSNWSTSLTVGSYLIPMRLATHLGIIELLAPESIIQLWTILSPIIKETEKGGGLIFLIFSPSFLGCTRLVALSSLGG